VLELTIPIDEFLSRAIAASTAADYLAFITIIARTADAGFVQDELIQHWESLDDLTADEILILSPKSNQGGDFACVPHSRTGAGQSHIEIW
jgi:hypothetical protein